MGKKLTNQKIENLDKKISRLQARKMAEVARLKKQKRKEDTRRKILVGAYYLDQAEKKGTMEKLKKMMDKFLVRENDRKLFGLSPLSKAAAPDEKK